MRQFWDSQNFGDTSGMRKAMPFMKDLIGEIHRAEIPLICGTDLANGFLVAGFSLHEEMARMQDCGIPAADVLRAATLTPARFCGVGDRLGSVTPGKTASLVLVRKNPLEDIRGASEIAGVFLRGEYLDRPALDDLLAKVEEKVKASTPKAAEVDLSLPGKVLRKGRFSSKFGKYDAGVEDFVITETEDAYLIKAHIQPKGGPQPPSVCSFEFGKDFSFRSAKWQHLTEKSLLATYSAEGGVVKATARQGDEELAPQSLEIPEDPLFNGPASAIFFAQVGAASLEVGETKAFKSLSFGFPSWQWSINDATMTRREHCKIEGPARRRYLLEQRTSMGDFTADVWTDAEGYLVRMVMKFPFGTITTVLEE